MQVILVFWLILLTFFLLRLFYVGIIYDNLIELIYLYNLDKIDKRTFNPKDDDYEKMMDFNDFFIRIWLWNRWKIIEDIKLREDLKIFKETV